MLDLVNNIFNLKLIVDSESNFTNNEMPLFERFGSIVTSRNVPFICLWVRNPACTLQAWMGDNRESKLRPKKHCKSSPFLPFANRIPSIEKCVNFATLAIFGSFLPYLASFWICHMLVAFFRMYLSKTFTSCYLKILFYILHEVFFAL